MSILVGSETIPASTPLADSGNQIYHRSRR